MKIIGLIGGMSWESSVSYYRIINEEIKTRQGGFHSAKCILYSVDFGEMEVLLRNNQWDKIEKALIEVARSLELAGAELVILCTNTMHNVADQIQNHIDIPFLHIADITAKKVLDQGIKTVGLLGTKYTMEQEFYKGRLEEQGIQVVVPNGEDRDIIHAVIFEELCLGSIREESRQEYQRIIAALIEQGAEGIILGCTEIGLLVQQEDAEVPLFDTTVIHAQGAVDYALK